MRAAIIFAVALIVAGSAEAATRYRVSTASASARLVFDVGTINTFTRGTSQVDVRSRGRPVVTLSAAGGRVAASLRGRKTESARVGQRPDETSPYDEQGCANRTAVSARGGLLLRRIARGRLQVRWGFPHAAMSFCPGPARAALRSLARRMVAVIPASRVGAGRLVLRLRGTARFPTRVRGERGTGTYTWRATVTLVRL